MLPFDAAFRFIERTRGPGLPGRFGFEIVNHVKSMRLSLVIPVFAGIGGQRKRVVDIVGIGLRIAGARCFRMRAFCERPSAACQNRPYQSAAVSARECRIARSVCMGERYAAPIKHGGTRVMTRCRSIVGGIFGSGFREVSVLTGRDFQLGTAICMISVARRRMAAADAGAVIMTATGAAMSLTA